MKSGPLCNAPALILVLTAAASFFHSETVSALRYGELDNVTFVNTGCDGAFCAIPYLTQDESNTFSLGFVRTRSDTDAYTLSVYWRVFGAVSYVEVMWSANRDTPVRLGAKFTFLKNGSLILYDSDGTLVWSTKTDHLKPIGLDMDTSGGNLVLYGGKNQTVWQSFDFPTDTLLQGQKLDMGMKLVSNVSNSNFSQGTYSLEMEPGGPVLYASFPNPRPYWTWGYYIQGKDATVSDLSMVCDHPVTMSLIDPGLINLYLNRNMSIPANYTSQTLCNLPGISDGSNNNSRETSTFASTFGLTRFMRLESDGNLRVYVYSGVSLTLDYSFIQNQCDLPEFCGPYASCQVNGQCSCLVPSSTNQPIPAQGCPLLGGPVQNVCNGSGTEDSTHMTPLNSVDYYWNRFTLAGNHTTTQECESLCRDNCACTASFYNSLSSACFVVSEPLLSLRVSGDLNLTAFVKSNGVLSSPGQTRSIDLAKIIGIAGASLFVMLSALIAVGLHYQRKARLARKSEEDLFLGTLPGLPPRFSAKELSTATVGFTKILGSGGFGTVYEGILPDGSKVAVKKLQSAKGTKDFRAEMATLGSIHHVNLVRLRGFCAEGPDCMLVYEYMPNGSLDKWLFNNEEMETDSLLYDPLNWETRFKIALGTARGLAYLHEECAGRIIHLDIKPQNILLDDNFLPKVADFGLSKLVDKEMSEVVTTMRGTPGYLAPEWLLHAAVTERTDVYSYGMVLLELVSGRKGLNLSILDDEKRYLPGWALRSFQRGKPLEIVDKQLIYLETYDEKKVTTVIHIAFLCIQEEMKHRPPMSIVVQMLEGHINVPTIEEEHLVSRYRFGSISGPLQSLSSVDKIDSTTIPLFSKYHNKDSSNSVTAFSLSSGR